MELWSYAINIIIHLVHVHDADVFFHICLLFQTIDALDQWEDLTDLGKYTVH